MVAQYKKYAMDLYRIKIKILGAPGDDRSSLLVFLQKLAVLRPMLRVELYSLSKEFLSTVPSINSTLIQSISEVNTLIMRKLSGYCNNIKRKANSLVKV